jgi:hypothetical protein
MAVAAAAAALVSQAAQAQPSPNDLVLNFASSGVANDYTIDLGNVASSVGVGGSAQVNLSSAFSLSSYNLTFSSHFNPVTMGAVAGLANGGVGSDLFLTELRTGSNPASLPGSAAPTTIVGGVGSAVAIANGVPAGAAFSGLAPGQVPQSDPQSWTSQAGNFLNAAAQNNPQSAITGSVIQEDLWEGVDAYVGSGRNRTLEASFDYVGYLTLNTGSGSLSFTPTAPVPEPTTGVLVGAGLLALCLYRRLGRGQS